MQAAAAAPDGSSTKPAVFQCSVWGAIVVLSPLQQERRLYKTELHTACHWLLAPADMHNPDV